MPKTSIAMLFGLYRPLPEILGSISFAVITFVYAFTVSSFFNLRTFIVLDKVTYDFVMAQTIISQYADQLLIMIGTFVWLVSFLNHGKARIIASISYGVLALLAVFSAVDLFPLIVSIVSFPMIVVLFIYNNFAPRKLKILRWSFELSLNYLWIISLIIGVISLAFSLALLLPFSVPTSKSFHDYAYEIFLMLSVFSPIFIVLLIFCIPLKLGIDRFMKKWSKTHMQQLREESLGSTGQDHETSAHFSTDTMSGVNRAITNPSGLVGSPSIAGLNMLFKKMIRLKTKIVCLALSMILSAVLASIPHLPAVNSSDNIVGVDTHYYVSWTKNLTSSTDGGPAEVIANAFVENRGDRPLSLLIVFYFVSLFGTTAEDIPHSIDNNLPLVLAPTMVLAVYFMTKQMTSSDIISILAASLTAVSYHTLIGIYAGFFANWIALIIGYVSIGFLFRFLNKSRKSDLAVFFVAMIALILAHTYTWTVFVIIISIFLLIMLRMNLYQKRSIFLLLILVVSSVAVDVSKSALVGTNLAIQNDIRFMFEFGMGPSDPEGRLDIITFTVQRYLGGLFANFIILLLGIYWLVRCNHKHPSNILLFLFFSTGIIPLFIGDWLILARLLYIIPFQLPAAIALATILYSGQVERKKISYLQTNQLQKLRQREMYEEGLPTPLISNRVIILVVFIWLISMSIKALTNLPPYA